MKRSQVTIAIVAVFAVALVYILTSGGGGSDDGGSPAGGGNSGRAPACGYACRSPTRRRRRSC